MRRRLAGFRQTVVSLSLASFVAGLVAISPIAVSAQVGCPGTPVYDTTPNPLTGIINSYYPGLNNENAGATVIEVGPRTGSSTVMAIGDLAMIIQMQDATFDRNNDQGYGDNVNGDPDSGLTALNSTGLFEFVRITGVTGNPPTSFTIQSTGAGGGLLNAYHAAAPDLTGGTQNGQKTFQVVRVPQYFDNTVGAGLTAKAWGGPVKSTTDGPTGGILTFDVANVLTLNSQTISVDGLGFRGGGGRALGGGAGASTDRVTLSTNAANGSKGEGIAGTPRYVYEAASNSVVDNTSEGYPAGSSALGAPGNAGGGGTDGTPNDNADNSGGGGGGNCGAGGKGGNAFANQAVSGGWGGSGYTSSNARVALGGGGGAGSSNNGSADDGVDHIPANGTGLASSGGAGGGMVIIRAWRLSGTGTINANGVSGPADAGRDGGGGGGAGGSVVLATIAGPVLGVTVNANGANGRNAWPSRSPAGTPGERHGPGGGGGGGAVYSTGPLGASSVTGGTRGITTTANDVYGSTNGSSGCVTTLPFPTVEPGVTSGGECRSVTSADLVSFEATKYATGVLLRWKTGLERDNLGFRIQRQDGNNRRAVTSDIIAGSTLSINPPAPTGYTYSWWDPKGTDSSVYYLEDVDFNGTGVSYGPFLTNRGTGDAPFGADKTSRVLADAIDGSQVEQTGSTTVWSDGARSSDGSLKRGAVLSGKPGTPGGLPSGTDPQALQWQIAGQPAVKLTVTQPGWYRVTDAQLAGLGIDLGRFDPRTLRLFADGVEMAIQVSGEADGRFDQTDAVEFFGSGVDIATTNARVYWLTAGGVAGKRVKLTPASGQRGVGQSFPSTVELKERLVYFTRAANGEKENWFGRVVSAAPVNETLTLNHVDAPAGGGRLDVALQGVTNVAHDVAVSLNGVPVGSLTYSNAEAKSATIIIPGGVVREGDNVVTLTRQGGTADISLVDSIRLTYTHAPIADNGELVLIAGGRRPPQVIGGFSDPSIRVVDVTDPSNVAEYAGTVTQGQSGYDVNVAVPTLADSRLYAFTPGRVLSPASIELNSPSSWNLATNAADVVMITHRSFAAELAPLVALRRAQGHTVAVVDVQDLYDEFSFGYHAPAAIRAFMARARSSWRTPPQFVLLVGDASLDPRDYRHFGAVDFVPTKLIETTSLECASDDWLVDANNDDVPDVAIGRLPVNTVGEAHTVVSKIVAYSGATTSNKTALIVADLDDGMNFAEFTAQLRASLPGDVTVDEIRRGDVGDAQAHAQVIESLNTGRGTVFYAGHGSVDLWRGSVLTSDDAAGLQNGPQLSIVSVSTCLNGYFIEPLLPSLGEELLQAPDGGAVAVLACSGIVSPIAQQSMNLGFYRQLYALPRVTVGQALVLAKQAGPVGDARRTLVLLGDPLTELK